MRIWIQGETEMDCFLKSNCTNNGMTLSSPAECDLAVLQFPYSIIDQELIDILPERQKIICGKTDEKTDRIAEEKTGLWLVLCKKRLTLQKTQG